MSSIQHDEFGQGTITSDSASGTRHYVEYASGKTGHVDDRTLGGTWQRLPTQPLQGGPLVSPWHPAASCPIDDTAKAAEAARLRTLKDQEEALQAEVAQLEQKMAACAAPTTLSERYATHGGHCYQQDDSDCSHWCVRIASEFILKRTFTREEQQRFYSWGCSVYGDFLRIVATQIPKVLPSISRELSFTVYPESTRARRGQATVSSYVTVARMEQFLDQGFVLLLNLQNVRFVKNKFLPSKREGWGAEHCVCCVGHTREKSKEGPANSFIILDSNSKKTRAMTEDYEDGTYADGAEHLYPVSECVKYLSKAHVQDQKDATMKDDPDATPTFTPFVKIDEVCLVQRR